MSNLIRDIFKNKRFVLSKLEPYGFTPQKNFYECSKVLSDSGLKLTVRISVKGEISSEITDIDSGEPYTLHLSDSVTGSFVGAIKNQYEETLSDIAASCFESDVFKSKQAKELIEYVKKTYGDELEFLWQKFPENAVWRRKDSGKWYGALLTVSKRKLGIESDEIAEIIDLRVTPKELESIIDNNLYFPGYHMNKKHWYTLILNDSVSYEEIIARIDKSYLLAGK